jgi:hypothetical protein
VRKYRGTPVAAKSLFFLGESYRKEKNNVKAALAYEALLQHYPESKFAPEAKTYLAQLEKEKQDPLAMLLMRDRRPTAVTAAGTAQETANNEKLKDVNLTAKTDIVYEEPGDEKSIFRRVADKINPFSSSDDGKKAPESPTELAAKKNTSAKEDSPGVLGSLWNGINPFGGQKPQPVKAEATAKNDQLVNQIDGSLKQKGIDSSTQTASLQTTPEAMSKVEEAKPPPQTMDTSKLLGDIDANLKKSGKSVEEMPAPPEADAAFRDAAVAEAVAAKTKTNPEPQQDVVSGGLLSGIDQKLKSQGLEPSKFEAPPTANPTPQREPTRKVELEPKVAVEKGPLFLDPTQIPVQEKTPSTGAVANQEKQADSSERQQAPGDREFPRTLVKGPVQPQPVAKTAEQKRPLPGLEDEPKGVFDQLKDDMENVGKVLNPFRW